MADLPTAPAGATRAPSARDLIARHRLALDAAGVPNPDADARWLAEHVLGRQGLRSADPVDPALAGRLAALVDRRTQRVPLQHLLGTSHFRHVVLEVRPGVFVPRPETEIVAGHAVAALAAAPAPRRAIDACTGTGAIALSLATEVEDTAVVATDTSPEAVALASANAEQLRAGFARGSQATVRQGHLLAVADADWKGELDLLVSNPPYLAAGEVDGLEPEVRLHDPHDALVGGEDGYEVVRELLDAAATWLRPGGTVVLEIADGRGVEAGQLARDAGLEHVEVLADLTGRERVLVARRTA